jgi:hypothetical protein
MGALHSAGSVTVIVGEFTNDNLDAVGISEAGINGNEISP